MYVNGTIQPVYNNVDDEVGTSLLIKGGSQTGGGLSTNDAGGALKLYGGAGTGTGAGGKIEFYVAKAGTAGTAQNTWAKALDIDEDKKAAFAGEVTIAGDLTVTGTTTTVDTVTMEAANAIVFEGATTNSTTTTLTIVDPLSNQTIYLPDAGGYIPLIADASTTDGAVTATEFALLDGDSSVGTDALASGDGFLHNDDGTMKHTSIATLGSYFGDNNPGVKSFVLNHSVDGVAANNAGADSNIFTITHGFTATFLVKVEVLEIGSSYATVYTDITRPTNASVAVTFATVVANGDYVALLTRVG
jgi:acyl-CoA thioesterase FadM